MAREAMMIVVMVYMTADRFKGFEVATSKRGHMLLLLYMCRILQAILLLYCGPMHGLLLLFP
jgi:hypothetical protein